MQLKSRTSRQQGAEDRGASTQARIANKNRAESRNQIVMPRSDGIVEQ
jgi:hypothetical protein